MKLLILLILFFPLTGFLINTFAGSRLKGNYSGIISSLGVFISFVLVTVIFLKLITGNAVSETINFGNWLHAGSMNVPFEFRIDPLSVTMMMIVTGIGSLILVYSIGYMMGDERVWVFFANMNLFTFAMLVLVSAANYILLFAGWEGVGLCSYLLIGFWSKNDDYNYAARKAFVMNRIGDLGFLLGLIILFIHFESFSYDIVFSKASGFLPGDPLITVITILMLTGAIGKSAQIPLYTWLPDAMAGPTPVSAFIHAATMVTAGVYMIARSNILFILSPVTMNLVLIIGIVTAIFAATIGVMQKDIKKILAYSTVSQLGYMFVALGLGAFTTSLFHLTTHAFFKALLFLAAGSVIHSLNGEQDLRNMGGLRKHLPVTFITFLVATLAISGIPPFSGFFSKDEILISAFVHNPVLWILAVAGTLITCIYMFRLLYLTFYGNYRGENDKIQLVHESPKIMTIPLIILAILSFAGGLINIPSMFGGSESFGYFLNPLFENKAASESQAGVSTEVLIMAVSLVFLLLVIFFTYRQYIQKQKVPAGDINSLPVLYRIIAHKYYIDELYDFLFEKPYRRLSDILYSAGELKIIDFAVEGIARVVSFPGKYINMIQNGRIRLYLFGMVTGIIILLVLNMIVL
jgi:NADH-quinone oxidoreductase subunit L